MMGCDGDRPAVRDVQKLDQHDGGAHLQAKAARGLRVGAEEPRAQHPALARFLVMGAVSHSADAHVHRSGLHKDAASLLDTDQTGHLQVADGPAQRMPVDAETLSELGLRGQFGAGRVNAAGDIGFQRLGDLPPQRNAA